MTNRNVISLDLAKTTIQIAKISHHGEVIFNKAQSPAKVKLILANSAPSIVTMEGCGSFHYWGRLAQQYGHEVRGMSPKHVKPYVSRQKTDANDAIGIAIAAKQPNMPFCVVKSVAQQNLQCLTVSRKFLDKQVTQLGNHMRALVYEYGVAIGKSKRALNEAIPRLCCSQNSELPAPIQMLLTSLAEHYRDTTKCLKQIEKQLKQLVGQDEQCQRLLALEGVGEMGAAGLVANLAHTNHFKNGREASVYLGVTPKQFSSGGKTVMIGIDKRAGDSQLKSNLFLGALAYISRLKESPTTHKQQWLLQLVARVGVKRACIALINKTIRTAWSMLKYGTHYKPATLSA